MNSVQELEIPSYFLCPISLQIMRDPVTLSTGITYDRESIEQWLYSGKNRSCPVTKQPVCGFELIPNHTLRRLIQAWCAINNSSENGIERFPTPKPPVNKEDIKRLLETAIQPKDKLSSLRKVKSILLESESNKRCVEQMPYVVNSLSSIVASGRNYISDDEASSCEEALSILTSLELSEETIIELVSNNTQIIESLTLLLQSTSIQSRSNATNMLKSICGVVAPSQLTNLSNELFEQVVRIITDRVSIQTTKSALHILAAVCPWGRNRVKAVEAGGVHALVELLLDENDERRVCELALVVLDRLCGCAEGRAKLVEHKAGVYVVSKKIMRVSRVASERAVRVLHSVAVKSMSNSTVVQEMVQFGVVGKLCLVMQVDECGVKAKEKVREILKLHSRVWKCSPCLSAQFKNCYPLS